MARRLSRLHSGVFRLTGGRVGRRLVGNDMLLLTTTGHRTGSPHTVPLLYLTDDPDLVVFASWGGRPYHPDWYVNLSTSGRATVQVDRQRFDVTAHTVDGGDRTRLWERAVSAWPDYATYQRRTDRVIPVVRLQPQTVSDR